MLPHPDIPRDVPGLIDGDEKPRLVGKLQRQHLPLLTIRGGELLQAEKTAHTMVGVDHQVSLGELSEIDVGTRGPLPLASQMEASETQARGSAEKFRLREDRKPPPRMAEATGYRAETDFRKGFCGKRPRGEFEKALTLTLGRAHQDDPPTGFLPFRKMPEELCAAGLVDHEIPRTKGGEGDRVEGLSCGFGILPMPAFQRCRCGGGTDPQRTHPPGERGFRGGIPGLPSHLDDQVGRVEVPGERSADPVRVTGLDLALCGLGDRSLRIGVELPDRLDPLLVKLQTAGQGGLPGKKVEDAAAKGEFPASGHLGYALVSRLFETHDDRSRSTLPTLWQDKKPSGEILGGGNLLVPLTGRDDRRDGLATRDPSQQGHTLRGNLGIGQPKPGRGDLQIRKESRAGPPDRQLRGEFLLGPDITANKPDPSPFRSHQGGNGPQKRPRLLAGITKDNRIGSGTGIKRPYDRGPQARMRRGGLEEIVMGALHGRRSFLR